MYLSNIMLRFDDASKLKQEETFGFSGSLVDVTLIKSRNNKAGQAATLVFDQDNGFDPELSLFLMLKNAGRVKGAGAYLYLGDRDDMKFSQKTFKSKLETDPDLKKLFIDETMAVLKGMLDKLAMSQIAESAYDFDISKSIMEEINCQAAA